MALLTEAAGRRGSSRVARHFRHHSPHRRHTDNSCQYISRFCTASRQGSTRTRLNNRERKKLSALIITGIHLHLYCICLSSLSFTFVLTAFDFYRRFILSLCLHCYHHHHHHYHHHCLWHNLHQLTAVLFVGSIPTVVEIVTAVVDNLAFPVVALEFVGATAFFWRGCTT